MERDRQEKVARLPSAPPERTTVKLAVAVASDHAPPSAFVVWRGFEESIRKAGECGYHGVELALKESADIRPDQLSCWLARAGLEVSCITTGQVAAVSGLSLSDPDESGRQRALAAFIELIGLARDFGRMVNIGRARGSIPVNGRREETERLFSDSLLRLSDAAGPLGVEIVIEPVNRYEINFLNSVAETAELLQRLGRDNIGLMPDTFHMNIEDADMGGVLVSNAKRLKYIHFADSNRLAPGNGHLDFGSIIAALRKAEYDRWISIEILPKPDPDTAARDAARYVLPRLAHSGG